MVHLIVAMTPKGVIGKNGTLPWHIPSDLKHFKELTSHSNVIMGRKTFDSLNMPNGLPNRRNHVVSRKQPSTSESGSNVRWAFSVEEALLFSSLRSESPDTFIIGGAAIYEYALTHDLVDFMHISFVKGEYDGDTKFPEFDKKQWDIVGDIDKGDFIYVTYKFLGETNRNYMNLEKVD